MCWQLPVHSIWFESSSDWLHGIRVQSFLVHLSRRLKCTIMIMRCPSSVVVNFSHFRLLLWNRWTEFNETWQEARSSRPLPNLCFFGPIEKKTRWPSWPLIGWYIFDFSSETAERNSTKLGIKHNPNVLYQVWVFWVDPKNKMAALASDWPRHFWRLIWHRWTEFNETWHKAKSQCPLPSLCVTGRSEKQDGRPGLWLAETFSTSPLKPLNGIPRNLAESKISLSSSKLVFFGSIGKTRWPPWSLIGRNIFDFSFETAERNSTKLDRKQDLLPILCVTGRSEKQDGRPGLRLDDTFSTSSLKLQKEIQWNLTGSKISTSSIKFVFFGPFEKQDGRHGLWLAEIFSTSPLKPLIGIQRNLTGSKISTSITKFMLFWWIRKTTQGSDWLKHFWLLLWKRWTKFIETWQVARYNVLYLVCVFKTDE